MFDLLVEISWKFPEMTMRNPLSCGLLFSISVSMGGCFGVTTPDMQEPHQVPYFDQLDKENTVLNQIKCEMKEGIETVVRQFANEGPGKGYNANWLKTWAAKVTLTLTVEEQSSINPSFTHTNIPGVFTIGAGLMGSADATRIETISVAWSVPFIRKSGGTIPCSHVGKYLVESDLKIPDFIERKVSLARLPGNIDRAKLDDPFDAFQYQATFKTTLGGNISPVWKFTRFTVNDSGNLFDASRVKTDDVLITMGPASEDDFGKFNLAGDAEDLKRASLIGQAIRSNLR